MMIFFYKFSLVLYQKRAGLGWGFSGPARADTNHQKKYQKLSKMDQKFMKKKFQFFYIDALPTELPSGKLGPVRRSGPVLKLKIMQKNTKKNLATSDKKEIFGVF